MDNVTRFPGGRMALADEGVENTVLGALLNAEGHPLDCREEVIELLGTAGPRAFTVPANQTIFKAFVECLIDGASTGPSGVTAALRKSGDLSDEVLERVYELHSTPGGPVEAGHAARVLRDLYRRRTVSQAMTEGARLVQSGEEECDTAISDAFGRVAQAVEEGDEPPTRYERDRLVEEGLGVVLGLRQRTPGLSYGFADLDERTTGMHPGHLTAIAARSGGGKTVMGLNIARHVAVKQGVPAAFFSLEMNPGNLIQRCAATELGIPFRAIQNNDLTPEQREAIHRFAERERENRNFRVEYVPGATAGELYLLARKARRDMGAEVIVVDYAQEIQTDRPTDDMNTRMTMTVGRVNEVATKLNTHVALLAQLKKPQQGREGEPPTVHDILWGTKIENVATTIFLLHRLLEEGKPGYEAEVHTVKNRYGVLGVDKLKFDGARMRFLPPEVSLSFGRT